MESDHKLMTPSGMGLVVCGAPLFPPWCAMVNMPTGVNLNRYAGPGSCIRWHSDNEPLFGPQNSRKLTVSMSLGYSVELQVRRRASGEVPSSITLDHGDLLVMDGLAQPEYVHRTVPGLQGLRVNLTFRWVTQHAPSCPLAGGVGETKWISVWGLVLLLSILVLFLLVNTWIHNWERHRHSCRRPSHLVVHFPSRVLPVGLGDGVGDCHDAAIFQEGLFLFPLDYFRESELCFYFRGMVWCTAEHAGD